jgi:hypothetical protein
MLAAPNLIKKLIVYKIPALNILVIPVILTYRLQVNSNNYCYFNNSNNNIKEITLRVRVEILLQLPPQPVPKLQQL